jgi:hypothetical protein
MRSPYSPSNPPAQCPDCRKKLLRPPYYRSLENKGTLDENLNQFLTDRRMQGKLSSTEVDDRKLEQLIDARIQERGLNIRTFWYHGKLYLSKY